jgi:hypothetical protein
MVSTIYKMAFFFRAPGLCYKKDQIKATITWNNRHLIHCKDIAMIKLTERTSE